MGIDDKALSLLRINRNEPHLVIAFTREREGIAATIASAGFRQEHILRLVTKLILRAERRMAERGPGDKGISGE
jgi:hypothetical protein